LVTGFDDDKKFSNSKLDLKCLTMFKDCLEKQLTIFFKIFFIT